MIIDDLARRSKWVRDFADEAHAIEVQYPVYPINYDNGKNGQVLWTNDRIPESYTKPIIGDSEEGELGRVQVDLLAYYARAPFEKTIIFAKDERSALFVRTLTMPNDLLWPSWNGGPPVGGLPTRGFEVIGVAARPDGYLDVLPSGVCMFRRDEGSEIEEIAGVLPTQALLSGDDIEDIAERNARALADYRRFYGDWWLRVSNLPRDVIAKWVRDTVTPEWMGYNRPAFDEFVMTVVTTFTLMNVKSVRQNLVEPFLDRAARRRIERGEPKPYKYHVLDIRPFGSKRSGDGDGTGAPKAEHWTRCHIRIYTEDAPMFGNPKLVGPFVIPPHRSGRGTGFVDKDYRIEAAS